MCFGGDDNDNELKDLRLENVQKLDPQSEKRQVDFWNQAQQYAGTSPFQQQYGTAADMPGLGTMSRRGQQYLTNQILGPGAYGPAVTGNLGFTPYAEPAGLPESPAWAYDPNIETYSASGGGMVRAGTGYTMPPGTIPKGKAQPRGGGNVTGGGGGGGGGNLDYDFDVAMERGAFGKDGYGFDGITSPGFPTPPITGTPPDTGISPSMGPIDIDRVDGYSSTVGIEEMQRAADASRVLLGQTAPGAPSYTDIATPSIATPTLTATTAISAGTGNVGSRFAEDGTLIDTGYGYDTGVSIDPNTGAMSGGIPKYATDVTTPIVGGERGQFIDTIQAEDIATVDDPTKFFESVPTTPSVDPITGVTTGGLQAFTPATIGDVQNVSVDPISGVTTGGVQTINPGSFAGPQDVSVNPFTGASFLGSDLAPYMDQLGVDAQIEAAGLDYARAQNEEQARRAGSYAWGTRGDIPRAEQESQMLARIANIRRQGFTDAADRLERDLARQQAAEMQTQQLGTQAAMQTQQLAQQGGIRGAELTQQARLQQQSIEAERRQQDAAREQQARMQGQQLGTQAQMQTQQLSQAGDIRGAELTQQSRLQQQTIEAERRQQDAARLQQARMQGQDIASRLGMQTQQLQTTAGMQTQQLAAQAEIQNAQNDLVSARANLDATMQTADRQAQLDAQMNLRSREMDFERLIQNQQVGLQAGMQGQDLAARVGMQDANNQLRRAEANLQARLQENDQLGAMKAQQQIALAQAKLEQERANQGSSLQASGMGLDAQQAFRAQQLAGAQQLADIGGMRQGATFGAAQQLAGMGAAQDQARRAQQAFGYDQWLRGLEGGAEQLAMLQALQPGGAQYQYGRKPSVLGQIGGGILQGAGAAAALGQAGLIGSDIRLKENIELVGSKNGHNLYEFNYRNQDARWRGVMAQEVMLYRPDAVSMRGGMLAVNYSALGLEMEAV